MREEIYTELVNGVEIVIANTDEGGLLQVGEQKVILTEKEADGLSESLQTALWDLARAMRDPLV